MAVDRWMVRVGACTVGVGEVRLGWDEAGEEEG